MITTVLLSIFAVGSCLLALGTLLAAVVERRSWPTSFRASVISLAIAIPTALASALFLQPSPFAVAAIALGAAALVLAMCSRDAGIVPFGREHDRPCLRCGYDNRYCTTGVCSECGHTLPPVTGTAGQLHSGTQRGV